jgi:hypothetical protein
LYHACHKKELETILEDGELRLRSEWSLILPKHGLWSAPGVWAGLNYFHSGNCYGPFLIAFPISVLDGRHFMVFRRKDDGRLRYFFVQYEARIPIFSFEKNLWRKVDPNGYFQKSYNSLGLNRGGIYDIALTESIELDESEIEAVDHPRCVSQKCHGMSRLKARKVLLGVAIKQFRHWLEQSHSYARLAKRFPILDGASIELFDPSE